MTHTLPASGSVTPQPLGRKPRQASPAQPPAHGASRRAPGATQPQAPQCWPARHRHDGCPGGEDRLPRRGLPASGTTMRAAVLRASGTRCYPARWPAREAMN